jgi:TPR repeat protein
MRFLALIFPALLLSTALAFADSLDDGKAAWERKDWPTAVNLLQPLANQGNSQAQWIIANMHSKGQGFVRDEDEAFQWYQKSADQGYAPAELELGFRYRADMALELVYSGKVKRHHSDLESMRWWRKAAEQGNANAEEQIGYLYANGSKEIPKDGNEAMLWFRRAAEHGNGVAQYNLGEYYLGENHLNPAEALKWLQSAAEQNIVGSRTELAKRYASGELIKQDYPRAYMWTHLQTDPDQYGLYESTYREFSQKMTPEEIAEGERLVAEWRAKHSLPPPSSVDYDSIRSSGRN